MGVPQGSPLSPLLSNVFLDGMDKELAAGPWRVIRYADDFVIAAASREEARRGLAQAARWLRRLGLRLNLDKTRVIHFDQGFSFLGVRFRGRQMSAVQPGAEPWVLPRATQPRPHSPSSKPAQHSRSPAPTARASAPATPPSAQPEPLGPAAPSPNAAASAQPSQPRAADATLQDLQRLSVAPPNEPSPPRLRTLYLTEPGAYLHIDGERLLVGKAGEELANIPAEKVDQVVADAEGAVSFGALRLLLRHDATLLLTPGASDDPAGLLTPINGRQVQLRAAQFARLSDGPFRLALAKRIVQAKISNARTVLRRYRRFRPEGDRGEDQALQRLHAQCAQAPTLEAVRGYEGRAARLHFEALATLIDPRWGFDSRNRQPPQDPVNALLSYGYTVLFHNVHTFILRRGLDPFVGALHAPRDGHAALASDLMEPYRSLIVDATVVRFLTQDDISPESFDPDHPGRMPLEVKRRFIQALERKLASPVGRDGSQEEPADWRRLIERDVNAWAAAVTGSPDRYQPWLAR
jgi:CRISPR-associated protein Cas1